MVLQEELILRVITLWFLVLSQFSRIGMGPFKINMVDLYGRLFCVQSILCNVGEVIIFEHRRYISGLEEIKMVILSSYVLLACIKAIYKYGHAWVI